MAAQVRSACRRCYRCFSVFCRPTWQLSSAPSPQVQSEFHDRYTKWCCILRPWMNQCFVCNFLSVTRRKGQIASKKSSPIHTTKLLYHDETYLVRFLYHNTVDETNILKLHFTSYLSPTKIMHKALSTWGLSQVLAFSKS